MIYKLFTYCTKTTTHHEYFSWRPNRLLPYKLALDRSIKNGTGTEWSPIQSVVIQVITKSNDLEEEVWFLIHEYDHRQNGTTRSLVTN